MRKKRTAKLHLCRETVRELSGDLSHVAGAVPTNTCDCPPTQYLCPRMDTSVCPTWWC